MIRPVQYFTAEYLEMCKSFTPDQILDFLENFCCLIACTQMNGQIEAQPREYIGDILRDSTMPG